TVVVPPQVPARQTSAPPPPQEPTEQPQSGNKTPSAEPHSSHPETPAAPSVQDYTHMGTDIANRVQKQVDEQLRRLGIAPSTADGQSRAAVSCGLITKACRDAGFASGVGNVGKGLFTDCVNPLMQGKPQPRQATIPLPHVDPHVIAACKKIDPNFGHSKK